MAERQQINLYQPAADLSRQPFSARAAVLCVSAVLVAVLSIWAYGSWQVSRMQQSVTALEQQQRRQERDQTRNDPLAGQGQARKKNSWFGGVETGCTDGDRFGVQRPLHLIDHESEPGEIEAARPVDPAMGGFVRDDQPDDSRPEKEINYVTDFSGEPADRFEQDRDRRDEHNRRRSKEQVLLDKDERLDARFAPHDQHRHRKGK